MTFVLEDSEKNTVQLNMDIVCVVTFTKGEPSVTTFYFDHYTVTAEDLEVTDTDYKLMEARFKCTTVNVNRIEN